MVCENACLKLNEVTAGTTNQHYREDARPIEKPLCGLKENDLFLLVPSAQPNTVRYIALMHCFWTLNRSGD